MRLIDADALINDILTDYGCDPKYIADETIDGLKPYTDQLILERIGLQPTIAASPWHRVEEELPDEVGSYLVYAPTYIGGSSSAKECKAGVMFARWLKGGHWSIEVGYYKRPGCVTHWMPIEPPKEEA